MGCWEGRIGSIFGLFTDKTWRVEKKENHSCLGQQVKHIYVHHATPTPDHPVRRFLHLPRFAFRCTALSISNYLSAGWRGHANDTEGPPTLYNTT